MKHLKERTRDDETIYFNDSCDLYFKRRKYIFIQQLELISTKSKLNDGCGKRVYY